jgi:hypothetical protein
MRNALGLSLLVLTSACLREVETEFPEGLQPLEENTALAVDELSQEGIVFETGERDDGLFWLHGRGVVDAPLSDVINALADPLVVSDRRGVTRFTTEFNVEDGYDVSFATFNVKVDILTVEWTLTWRGSVIQGDSDDPVVFAMRYQKTDGAAILDVMEGSIVASALSDDRTELALIEHLKAPLTNEEDLLCYQQDVFDEVVLSTRGDDLPEYTENCR